MLHNCELEQSSAGWLESLADSDTPSLLLSPTLPAHKASKEKRQKPSSLFCTDVASHLHPCLRAQLLAILGHKPSMWPACHWSPSPTIYETSPAKRSHRTPLAPFSWTGEPSQEQCPINLHLSAFNLVLSGPYLYHQERKSLLLTM